MITRRLLLASSLASAVTRGTAQSAAQKAPDHKDLAGKIFFKGDEQYEVLRQAATWNARKPNRFPSAIVLAENEKDVIAAVKLAKARDWQVTARSGGHSFTGSHTRDNAVQINLARMRELSIDPKTRIATLSPSWKGGAVNNVLRDKYQLMFPIAHGYDIGLGGFVLCGGHGWNSRVFGLGCENLRALDVVTADGDLIHVDETQNSEFLWAARGSGPGFFGVAVRYYLDVHPLPTHIRMNQYVFPWRSTEKAVAWFEAAHFPDYMEPLLVCYLKDGVPMLQIMCVTFASSESESEEARAIMSACPASGEATERQLDVPAVIPGRSETEDVFSGPTGGRYAVDGAYTNAPLSELISRLHDELTAVSRPAMSPVTVGRWRPSRKVKDMVYSMSGSYYMSAMVIGYDPADDVKAAAWLASLMAKMTPIATGAQMNDENMPINKLAYLSIEASARLEELRGRHDPARRFASFLT